MQRFCIPLKILQQGERYSWLDTKKFFDTEEYNVEAEASVKLNGKRTI